MLARNGFGRDLQPDALPLLTAFDRYPRSRLLARNNFRLPVIRSESVAALVAAKNEHGWYEMAGALRDSGDTRLVDVAKQWELKHELELQAQP